ncbi:unnamed protein product [Rhizoctonia solani]|uniref:Tetrapyrrole methylase domain-containing protein n=1 Tax=Rhizoctonia solani TaxID=456999 RepID=A0A8H3E9C5_9AGAM|nr:unnamed protein product [Rhizoctonia solani]CAE7185546.1 unnamed protein product [Rhizoctonia solani]
MGHPPAGPGSLTIAGSGVSDRVHYLVPDPATQAYIRQRYLCTNDLAKYYRENQSRYKSYIDMSEVILRDVRAGYKVVAIINGHPGSTASPAHRALEIARWESYQVQMLPAISPQDCMIADLGIDPSMYGCMISEAAELLAHERSLNTLVHNIILNIGGIGERPLMSTLHYLD